VRRLSRDQDGRAAAPVRIAHLGLGNFFRAHQAWYTDRAADAGQWGIAAFAGRTEPPVGLVAQQGLYTLLLRDASGDEPLVMSSLSEVHGSVDLDRWRATFRLADLSIVTSTVTEAGYCRSGTGALDADDPRVVSDVTSLRQRPAAADTLTAPGKLVAGLLARWSAGLGGITLVPCDNLPENGQVVRQVVLDLAEAVDPSLSAWVADSCTFVTTMVDRITPRTTDEDRADLRRRTGVDDPACVVTERYSEWVLSGDFAAGRPAWDTSGARFVEDLVPWERRKLWLLNGSHSLMAYAAPLLGSETVADAIGNDSVRGWVDEWWDDAAGVLPIPRAEVDAYRAALLQRYANPRIRHLLAQIAADGSQKLPVRILPVLRARLDQGAVATGATRALAAWVLHLRGLGAPVNDLQAGSLRALVSTRPLAEAVRVVLGSFELDDAVVRQVVLDQVRELDALRRGDAGR
jgi:fructuronate reductase